MNQIAFESPRWESGYKKEIQEWLQAKLSDYLSLQPSDINMDEPFVNYGLDSATAISLAGELADWLGHDFPPTLLYDYPDIARLASYLAQLSEHADEPASLSTPLPVTNEPIALVGMACRFPGDVETPEEFWQLLLKGEPILREVPGNRWDINDFYDPDPSKPGKVYTRYGAFLTDIAGFDHHFFGISPAEALRMDPQQRLLLEVTWEALEDAGLAPDQLDGSKVAVFLGFMNNLEYAQLQLHNEGFSCVNDPYFGIGGSSSITSGRVSYLFNFQGPSMAIDTACSSSLVALHLACQSLRNNECDVALVSGVNMILLPQSLIHACKMRMLSADGLCKTFDAAADGYAMGEGCGVVVLKRLTDATSNQDKILALIRGTALNQDGRSNGITAPNKRAQEAVITQALANANVEPHQISYVEAHGSGTSLGDTIEMMALQETLGRGRSTKHPLLVGAVKTNIGHLAGAAGIAGLMKTVLALQHQTIPPHLNLKNPSPDLPWSQNTILVPTTLTAWPAEEQPRLAGVSSFGWSGTNAHVVLEEAPQPQATSPSRPWHLLLLSARSPSALERQSQRLATHLQQHPEQELADVAYTLQVGRATLPYRRSILCQEREQALTLLREPSPPLVASRWQEQRERPVAFLLPGLGELYAGMLAGLVAQEPRLAELLEEGASLLDELLGVDLRLWHQDAVVPVEGLPTAWAQPVTFLLEYALAQLLIGWGVRPSALLGYSVGEYVAACLAGVFGWQDGLRLLVRRGQLIEEYTPAGALLAVAQSAQELTRWLGEQVELAAITGPCSCVVGGPTEAIGRLERALLHEGIAARRVQARHAFHTSQLRQAAQLWQRELSQVQWQTPQMAWVSNLTGAWITAEQASDPGYWAEQMCHPVQFATGLERLLEQDWVLVEVGAGQTLSSYAKLHPACSEQRRMEVVATVRGQREREDDQKMLVAALSKLWLAGVALDWRQYWQQEQRRRLSLPTYPFERQRFWIEPSSASRPSKRQQAQAAASNRKAELADWFYLPIWKQTPPLPLKSDGQKRYWLIFLDQCGIGEQISTQLEAQHQIVVRVKAGREFVCLEDGYYSLNPGRRTDYEALLHELHEQGRIPERIVYLWAVTRRQEKEPEEMLDKCFYSPLLLLQALESADVMTGVINFITNDMQDVTGTEQLCAEKALILGLYHTVPLEYPSLQCRSIDIALPEPESQREMNLLKQLQRELIAEPAETLIALRGERRWEQIFEPFKPERSDSSLTPLRQGGVYLITGGLGGIGLAMAEHLAQSVKAKLVLVGRTGLPPRHEWEDILARQGAESRLKYQVHKVSFLEALGVEVQIFAADVTNQEQMQFVVQQTMNTFGRLDGVIHAAGIPGVGLIRNKTPEMASRVLAPKVNGTIVLERVLRNISYDFFVLFSSITASTGGGPGQVDYCAANAFLGAFAHSQRSSSKHRKITTIDWCEWQWNAWNSSLEGEALKEVRTYFEENRHRFGITFEEGAEVFSRVLTLDVPRVVIATQSFDELFAFSRSFTVTNILQQVMQKDSPKVSYPRPALSTLYTAPRNELEYKIATLWSNLLGIAEIGIDDNFFELGGNSLLGIDLIMRLSKEIHISQLPSHILYEAPTIRAIAHYIEQGEQTAFIEDRDSRGRKRRAMLENRISGMRERR